MKTSTKVQVAGWINLVSYSISLFGIGVAVGLILR